MESTISPFYIHFPGPYMAHNQEIIQPPLLAPSPKHRFSELPQSLLKSVIPTCVLAQQMWRLA